MTNTHTNEPTPTTPAGAARRSQGPSPGAEGRGGRRWVIASAAAIAVVLALVAWMVVFRGDAGQPWQTADINAPGGDEEDVIASDGARLQRRTDGLFVEVDVPTPQPGSYEYPTRDQLPPWVEVEHPPISPGAGDAPEVFTLWIAVFNDPAACTDRQCDNDDFAPDAPARGGVHQLDGRVADGDTLRFAGNLRLGQPALDGAPVDDPLGAEVHVLIAPHGRALSGNDLVIQLNTPVGNPTLWWGARFPPP